MAEKILAHREEFTITLASRQRVARAPMLKKPTLFRLSQTSLAPPWVTGRRIRNLAGEILISGIAAALTLGTVCAQSKEEQRFRDSARVFDEIMNTPDQAIPRDLLNRAACVAIIPSMKKGGFIVGGRYGKGMASCRDDRAGWGPPAMLMLEGGSFGLQIGGAAVDVVMLFMNKDGMDSLLKDKFTLGGDASAAAGPVGRAGTADTDAYLRAKILSYSRSKGVFAGLELKGAVLRQDKDANRAVYGKEITAREALEGKVSVPPVAQPVIRELTKYSPTHSKKSL